MPDKENHQRVVHVCIATGQNAANLIPLEQYDAREVWILQTPTMRANAANLAQALKKEGRQIERIDFDDSSPRQLETSAEAVAHRLDGCHVVLHATGGTKLMVLALRDGLRLVEAGSGTLEILYAETSKQQIDWLGHAPRTDAMADVLDLRLALLVQGYRIEGDSRHAAAQQRAATRAGVTREMGENAGRYRGSLSALAGRARRAADGGQERDLVQHFEYAPGGALGQLLAKAAHHGLVDWDGGETVRFTSREVAEYFAGGWIEEFVLLKLTGGLVKPGRFSSNLRVLSVDKNVPNEIDAIVIHRNRVLLIECKSGKQSRAQDALYKLAQLRQQLGGSVASALYLSAQRVDEQVLQRAAEYRIDVLCADEVAKFVPWLRDWLER
ncbi:MAG: DUF1887 family CARF protein [Burkholderiaceae bacterium]|nr:DUF1887 family CARF protein [Burkholderiaceae bacterium]